MTIWRPIWIFVYAVVVKAVVRGEEVQTVKGTEGETITLINLSRKKTGDVILWTFGTADDIIAQLVNRDTITLSGERFQDRLQLDTETGSLTISNIRSTDSGVYKVQLISVDMSSKHFRVIIYAPVSIPAIKNISEIKECQSQDWVSTPDLCTVLCTVLNGAEVSLSWNRGRETLKEISNPNLSILLCLNLEIHFQDKANYSCVATNPVSRQSTQLNIKDVCLQASLSRVHCCGPVELAVRLVLSAVVGMATVAILVYHFKSPVLNRAELN